MFRVQRSTNGDVILLTLSGRVDSENLTDLKTQLESENGHHIVLDLANLTLVDRESVMFLKRRVAHGIEIRNCPGYIREWMAREKMPGNRR